MFFDKDNNKEEGKSCISILIAFIISLILTFFFVLGWLEGIGNSVAYVLDPIYATSSQMAGNTEDFFSTLINISSFREEYNQMKVEIAQYEIDNLEYQVLLNENKDLKEQLKLKEKGYKYIQAEVLDHIETDYMIINVGRHDGVEKGDIVMLGEVYVGIVIDVGQYTSKVRLPISKSSFLESYIISSDTESDQKILSRAVVSGSTEGIKIENIGMNSGVKNGDVVIVNDSKVGENLILGTVVGLSEDPAVTTRTGYVSPAVDYYDLVNVFVKSSNDN
jgi:rod shape-determining protein MreC